MAKPWFGRTLEERIMRRVTRDDATGCWNYPTAKGQNGYATVTVVVGQSRKVHRVMYEILVGPIPDGYQLHHKCENRACCNPEHLQPTVAAEHNTHLSPNNPAFKHARKTHCKNGHHLIGHNVRARTHHGTTLKTRECVACRRAATKRWYATRGRAQRQRKRAS